ncbi:MAG: hypothetical protein J6V09_00525 [Clostridia bacterium]|nr:hypothetical protein [Clostridia bacterium]
MQFLLKKDASQIKTVATLSFLVVLLAFGCMFFGFLALPFAAAFYTALLLYDKKKIFALILPVPLIAVNVLINGFFSLEAIGYVLLGVVGYFAVKSGKSKAETAFWVGLVSAAIMIITAVLIAVGEVGEFSYAAIKTFYGTLYHELKNEFIKVVSQLTVLAEEQLFFRFSTAEAEMIYHDAVFLAPSILLLSALAIAGFMLKSLSALILKFSGATDEILNWHFKAPNIISYFYIVLAITNLFAAGSGGLAALTVVTLNTLFSVLFAYLGVKFLFFIVAYKRGVFFAIMLIGIGVMLTSGYAVVILSIVGVVSNIKMNKKAEGQG